MAGPPPPRPPSSGPLGPPQPQFPPKAQAAQHQTYYEEEGASEAEQADTGSGQFPFAQNQGGLYGKLGDEYASTKKQLDADKWLLASLEKGNAELKQTHESLVAERTRLTEANRKFMEAAEAGRMASQEIKQLRARTNKTSHWLAKMRQSTAAQRQETLKSEEQIKKMEAQIADMSGEKVTLTAHVTAIKGETSAIRLTTKNATEEREHEQQRLAEQRSALLKNFTAVYGANSQMEQDAAKIEPLAKEYQKVQEANNAAKYQNRRLRNVNLKMRQEVIRLAKDNKDLKKKFVRVKQTIDAVPVATE